MRFNRIMLSAILLLSAGLLPVHAQEAIPAAGGNLNGSGGSVSYSIGQLVYMANTGSTGSVAQGVQQPYEISIITGLKIANEIKLVFSVFPNPATTFIMLQIGDFGIDNLSYQLCEMNGKLIENIIVADKETRIDMHKFASGTYCLKVIQGNTELKTFLIIKN